MRQCLYSDFNQNCVGSIEAGAWNIMLVIPCEEHSQQEKVVKNMRLCRKEAESLLWKISPEEQEGMCQSVLSPITEKSEIQRSLFKQIIVTIRMKCFLDNDCSWC